MAVALTKTQAIALVQQGLSWRSDKSTEILLQMRLQQEELEKGISLPDWLLTEGTFANISADLGYGTIPSRFIRVDDQYRLGFTDSDGGYHELKRVDHDALLMSYLDTTTGEVEDGDPRIYSLRKTTITVRPIPSEEVAITGGWWQHDEDLNDVNTNLWLTHAPLVLVGKTGIAMAADLEHPEAANNFAAKYSDAIARFIADIAEKDQMGQTYTVGGDA